MIETVVEEQSGSGLSAADLAGWVEQLAGIDVRVGDAERIDRIRELERIKAACAAAQAVLTVAFVTSQTAGLSTKRARDERTRRSVSSQVALARCESPFRGGRHVGLARVLTSEMPNVFEALRSGVISEWRASLVVRETACLSVADRQQVDKELVGKLGGLSDRQVAQSAARIGQRLDPGVYVARARKAEGDRRVSCRPAPDTMTYVTALVPVAWGVSVYAALVKHAAAAKAVGDQRSRGQLMADEFVYRITQPTAAAGNVDQVRPVIRTPAGAGTRNGNGNGNGDGDGDGDGIGVRVGANLPAGSGSPADTGSSAGTGIPAGGGIPAEIPAASDRAAASTAAAPTAAPAAAAVVTSAAVSGSVAVSGAGREADSEPGCSAGLGVIPPGVGVDIQLVMSDRTLFDGDNEPAVLTGYGPIPAALARRLVREAAPGIKSWIRRLYTDPGTGQLIDADSKRRLFSPAARQFLVARDQTCRTPFCDAPIRHADHVVPHERGGPTRTVNGQGLCERCNHTKEQPGWHSKVDGHGITITTPTGHTARSVAPLPPRSTPWVEDRPIEYWPINDRPPRHPHTATPFERRLLLLLRSA